MAVQNRQWISLDECINSYIDQSEQSIDKKFKLFQLAYRAMTELGLDFFYTVQSIKIPTNANLTATLPANYLQYTKVGVLNDRGEVISFTYNSNLATYADVFPNRASKTEDFNFFAWGGAFNNFVWNNWWNGEWFQPLYGVPSGAPFVGTFKIDNANGVILLGENVTAQGFPPYVLLEYIASPKENETYYVPVQFKEAIVAYLGWKDIQFIPSGRRGGIGDKAQRRKDFFNERRLAIARYQPIYLEDAYNANLESQRMTVKV